MKTAVIYARYSSERQTEQSIEGQLRECTEYAKYNNICIVDTYIDRAMSGTNDNRLAFKKMLKDCEKQAWDIVLVYKLDRFSRNKYEMAIHRKTLRDNGVKLISAKENIPDSPEGIILESLLEGMAEYYSAELSQKVRRGMKESRLKGYYTGGGIPYGYKIINKKPVIDEDKVNIVVRIFEEYVSGKRIKDIAEDLTKDGIYHLKNPFTINTISKILQNKKYIGIFDCNGEIYENVYPRIISDELFYLTKACVEANRYGKHSDVTYLLKQKLYCGYCGNLMTSETGTSSSGDIKRYYKCRNRKLHSKCNKETVKKDIIENIVIDKTLEVFQAPILKPLVDDIINVHNKRTQDNSVLKLLLIEKTKTKSALDNVLNAIEKGLATKSTKERLEELEAKLSNLESNIAYEETKVKMQLTHNEVLQYFKKAIKSDPSTMIRILINKVILYDDKVEIYYKYTEHEDYSPFNERARCYKNSRSYLRGHFIKEKEDRSKFQESSDFNPNLSITNDITLGKSSTFSGF